MGLSAISEYNETETLMRYVLLLWSPMQRRCSCALANRGAVAVARVAECFQTGQGARVTIIAHGATQATDDQLGREANRLGQTSTAMRQLRTKRLCLNAFIGLQMPAMRA